MIYKGFDICYIQPVVEKQEIDENGNAVGLRDSWPSDCAGWYEASKGHIPHKMVSDSFAEIKKLIDAFTLGIV